MTDEPIPRSISVDLARIMRDYDRRLTQVRERVSIDYAVCTGCGKCVDACPTDVLRMDISEGQPYAAFPGDCCVCFLCQAECPVNCIVVNPAVSTRGFRTIYGVLNTDFDTTTVDKAGREEA